MNTSGDAAEQVVRLSLEGMEVAAKITGSAAKEVAALLYAALKNRDKNKIKGRQRLTSMLRSGKELTIFTVKNKDMARFVADAKRYGVVYCVLREAKDNPHGVSEIMVRAEDAAKINRIVENIKIATVSDPEVIRENAETGRDKNKNAAGQTAPEQERPQKSEDDRLLDEMMAAPAQKQEAAQENPTAARTEKSRPSEPSSKSRKRSAEGTAKEDRPSVREELRRSAVSSRRRRSASRPNAADPPRVHDRKMNTDRLRRKSGSEKVRRDKLWQTSMIFLPPPLPRKRRATVRS